MIEAERAVTELQRRFGETERQIRLEQHLSKPNEFRIRTLESDNAKLFTKIQRIKELQREVKDLETTLSMKMMTRYPANQQYKSEYKRDLHRTRKMLKDIAMRYQPKPKPQRPGYATPVTR